MDKYFDYYENNYILIKYLPLVMTKKSFKSDLLGITIEIDYDKCTGCGNCVDECPSDVYELINEKSACIAIDDCVDCCACIDACPENAITHSSCLD